MDTTIERHIDAATEQLEQDTDRAVIHQTFQHWLDAFPAGNIVFSIKPIESITSIEYDDSEGSQQTVDPSVYGYDEGRRHVYLKQGQAWPGAAAAQNSVRVTFVAGYGPTESSVPRMIKQGILLLVGAWFYPDDADEYRDAYDYTVDRILRSSYP